MDSIIVDIAFGVLFIILLLAMGIGK